MESEKSSNILKLEKIVKLAFLFSIITLVVSYLISVITNRFVLDDYWHMNQLSEFGFLGYIKHYYLNWEGSISHLLFIIAPINWGLEDPYIGVINILVISLLIYSFWKFSKRYNHKPFETTLILTGIFLISLVSKSEVLYWYSVNITYVTTLSFVIIYFSTSNRIVKTLCGTIICLNKLTIAISFLLISFFFQKGKRKELYLLSLFVLLNIFSCGNFKRYLENHQSNENTFSFEDIWYYFSEYLEFIPIIVCGSILVSFGVKKEIKDRELKLAWLLIIGISIFHVLFNLIAFGNLGPHRVYFYFPVIYSIGLIFTLTRFKPRLKKYKLALYLLFTLFSAIETCRIVNGLSNDWIYSSELDERKNILKEKDVNIDVHLPSNLHSIWINDSIWIKYNYIPAIRNEKN